MNTAFGRWWYLCKKLISLRKGDVKVRSCTKRHACMTNKVYSNNIYLMYNSLDSSDKRVLLLGYSVNNVKVIVHY